MEKLTKEEMERVAKSMAEINQWKRKYAKSKELYEPKMPSKADLKTYKGEVLMSNSTSSRTKYGRFIIDEKFSFGSEYYPLTNNEVVSIMEYYNVEACDITILHYKLLNVQGFTDLKSVTLKIPSTLKIAHMSYSSLREGALSTLLHEVSHMLGNTGVKSEERTYEAEADRFSEFELKKWKTIMNLED